MRQVMPHRNNIAVHRTKCKRFFLATVRPLVPNRSKTVEKAWIYSERMQNRDGFISFMIIRNNNL
jgi:hypothetical protein